jgi:hypothetical protein
MSYFFINKTKLRLIHETITKLASLFKEENEDKECGLNKEKIITSEKPKVNTEHDSCIKIDLPKRFVEELQQKLKHQREKVEGPSKVICVLEENDDKGIDLNINEVEDTFYFVETPSSSSSHTRSKYKKQNEKTRERSDSAESTVTFIGNSGVYHHVITSVSELRKSLTPLIGSSNFNLSPKMIEKSVQRYIEVFEQDHENKTWISVLSVKFPHLIKAFPFQPYKAINRMLRWQRLFENAVYYSEYKDWHLRFWMHMCAEDDRVQFENVKKLLENKKIEREVEKTKMIQRDKQKSVMRELTSLPKFKKTVL